MTLRIGQFIVAGELRNSRRNRVYGWIQLGAESEIQLELTGNFSESLGTDYLAFEAPEPSDLDAAPENLPEHVLAISENQIGVVDEIRLEQRLEVTLESAEESASLKSGDVRPQDLVVLRWFSQDGPIEAELQNLRIHLSEPEPTEAEQAENPSEGFSDFGFEDTALEADSQDLEEEADENEDPYGLFDQNLNNLVADSLGENSIEDTLGNSLIDGGERRSWDEVIPGIDPETKAMYEQWDEIVEGNKDEPITYLFEKPLKLPRPEHVESEEEARGYVVAILAQLARLCVALDVCEHFTALDTYKMLMEDILPTAKVHPKLAQSDMIQHFSTNDVCRACEAEFDAEFEGLNGLASDADEADDARNDEPGREDNPGESDA
ncbi:MAG: hypothetical protein VXZ82_20450 [Planctomycetota bacterium]|nr:hypothetical protein [Planctomycetota bacterium]